MSSKNILPRHMTEIHCKKETFSYEQCDATYGGTHGEKARLETVDDAKVEYEILGPVIKHQVIKERIKVPETADGVLGDNLNEVDDEKHEPEESE